MHHPRCGLFCIVALFPYVIGWSPSPEDTASTSLEFGLGFGSYADISRDCQGNVISVRHVPFSDVGGTLRSDWRMLRGDLSAGMATVDIRDRDSERRFGYLALRGGLNFKYLALQAGPFIPLADDKAGSSDLKVLPTGLLRLGKENGVSLNGSVLANTPLYTGGGGIEVGLSVRSDDNRHGAWVGLGAFPYDALALSLKYDFPVAPSWSLSLHGQIGTGQASEGAFGITTKYRY